MTTPGHRPGSEDPGLKLPTRSGAPRSTEARPTRDRATPPEEPPPPTDPTPHPEGHNTAPWQAPTDPSRDPSSDPSTPQRPEGHPGASSCSGHPKTAKTTREPASEPQDLIAATFSAPPPRRTATQEGGECVKTLRTAQLVETVTPRPRKITALHPRSPCSPRNPSTPHSGRASRLRRDTSHHLGPTPSSAEYARTDETSPLSSEELSSGARQHHRTPVRPASSPAALPPDPEGTSCHTLWRPTSPREDACAERRAASWLRRASRQGAERSGRLRLSPSSTPGRATEPEGSNRTAGVPRPDSRYDSETARDLRCESEDPHLQPFAETSSHRVRALAACFSMR